MKLRRVLPRAVVRWIKRAWGSVINDTFDSAFVTTESDKNERWRLRSKVCSWLSVNDKWWYITLYSLASKDGSEYRYTVAVIRAPYNDTQTLVRLNPAAAWQVLESSLSHIPKRTCLRVAFFTDTSYRDALSRTLLVLLTPPESYGKNENIETLASLEHRRGWEKSHLHELSLACYNEEKIACCQLGSWDAVMGY